MSKVFSREKWLAERRAGIGGSDVAAILGLSKWRTPLDVWKDKTGRADETPDNELMEWGRLLEPVIAKKYESVTGWRTFRHNEMIRQTYKGVPMIGNIDRAISIDGKPPVVRGEFRTNTILEIKTANAFTRDQWGEPGSGDIPIYYATQTQHYLALTGAARCDVAVLFGGNEFRIYTVERDDKIMLAMWDKLADWWLDYVVADVPPPPRTEAETKAMFPVSADREIVADDELEQSIGALKFVKFEIKKLQDREDEMQDKVCSLICDAERVLRVDGYILATWKSAKPSRKVDYEKAYHKAAELAKITSDVGLKLLKDCEVEKPGARRLLLK